MPTKEPIALCWSGGKDSSLALHRLRQSPQYEVMVLVTTFTDGYNRVSMHGVRYELLKEQAEAAGLPLEEVWIPAKADNPTYEFRMAEVLIRLRENRGILQVAFGDIYLEDLRIYREKQLAALGLKGLFPLWKQDTRALAREFVELGFRGVTTCVDPSRLDRNFVGREIDEAFFASLPADCDPCGENGEFHSFVYRSPGWHREISLAQGEIVTRDSFLFCDLLPLPLSETVSTE